MGPRGERTATAFEAAVADLISGAPQLEVLFAIGVPGHVPLSSRAEADGLWQFGFLCTAGGSLCYWRSKPCSTEQPNRGGPLVVIRVFVYSRRFSLLLAFQAMFH